MGKVELLTQLLNIYDIEIIRDIKTDIIFKVIQTENISQVLMINSVLNMLNYVPHSIIKNGITIEYSIMDCKDSIMDKILTPLNT